MKQYKPDLMLSQEKLPASKTNIFNCILLIDDDDITNYINVNLLKKIAIADTIKSFKNGREALDFIHSTDNHSEIFPDLIFLDIHMPIMDGYEFLNVFKSFDVSLRARIVILSTSVRIQDEVKLKHAGIEYFIDKPLTEEKVILLLKKMKVV